MIIWIVVFLLVGVWSSQCVSYSSIKDEKIIAYGGKFFYNRLKDDSLYDEKRERVARSLNLRSRRDSMISISTESSIRMAYERAMNRTIEDYYAQRNAVIERYYSRQREIIDKFGKKTTTLSPSSTTTMNGSNDQEVKDDESDTRGESVEDTTVSSKIWNNTNIDLDNTRSKLSDGIVKEGEKNNSSVAWIHRLNNMNSRVLESETDRDVEAASSTTSARRTHNIAVPGSYRLGQFRNSDDEKIIYQHNLGVGLKGPSQLEAIFEVVLDGAFVITVIEAFPYANTRAHFSWVSGGPGTNNVKLKLKGYENEGFSYSVVVWGVPI